jgi:KUP system potassium uptake protein
MSDTFAIAPRAALAPGGEFVVDVPGHVADTPDQPATTQPHAQPREHGDTASAQSPHARAASTGSLTLTAIGIVFGDIGTSPLYAFSVALSATGKALPVAADVLGIVSLVFWALILMVSLKYVVLILRADNDGEGGILALLSLVAGDRVGWSAAISVLSAMEGLKLIAPHFEQFTVPVTLAILIGLFLIQRRGTQSIGKLFGPVMLVWFVVIGLIGASHIWAAPEILKAVNPVEAGRFLAANPMIAFVVIGGIFLVVTGGEALYADMGHVGARAIRLAWFGLVLPALLLCYFGQGALMLTNPKAVSSPFYHMAPQWALIPMVALAAMATIIASQALISGVFSLTRQAIQLGLCPRIRIVPTSSEEAGQIYVPTANWMLMTGTLLVVLLFKTSDNLASAYGIAVSGTMLITTILFYRVAVGRWKWWPAVAIPIVLGFGTIDTIFLVSNSIKIVQGGWFPITVGAAIVTVMLCWRRGTSELRLRLREMSMPLEEFVKNIDQMVVARCPGVGVWLTRVDHGASPMLLHHVKHDGVMHEKVVLLTFVHERRPRVPFAERYSLERLGNGFFRIKVRLGFMQTPDIPHSLRHCKMLGFDIDFDHVNYYIGHETVVRRAKNSAMGPVSFAVFAFLTRIATRAPDFFRIPQDELSEVGYRVEI